MPNTMGPMPSGLMPGANFGGSNTSLPQSAAAPASPAVGGNQNPFLSAFPQGQSFPAYSSPYAQSGTGQGSQMGGFPNLSNITGNPKYPQGLTQQDMAKGFHDTGMPWQLAEFLSNFLYQGAGFNSDVANALVAAMQPQIAQGQTNLLEQFGSMGLRGGSPAALGLAGYNAQTNLGVGEIFAQMYEQSVQNYLGALLGQHKPSSNAMGGLGSLMGGAGSLMGGLSSLGIGIGGAGAAAGGSAGALADIGPLLAAGLCWVAAEVFDGWDDPRTHAVRGWLLGPFSEHWYGRLVVKAYRKYGEWLARQVRRHRWVRRIVTPLFYKALEYSHGDE